MRRKLQHGILVLVLITILIILFNHPQAPTKLYLESNLMSLLGAGGKSNNGQRIFCIITTEKKNLDDKARVIYETWAKKCDNYKFISVIPSSYLKSIDPVNINETSIEVEYGNLFTILQPAGLRSDSGASKITDKVLLAFKDIYNRYGDYDWYLRVDDDTFIFVDNLRKFLRKKNSSMPITFGYDLKPFVDKGYHSTGGGYVLSREAMNRIGSELNKNYSFCNKIGNEDIEVARCLRELGVFPKKSIDLLGRERFHCLNLRDFYYGFFYDWLKNYAANPLKRGLSCCSDTTVSFHYILPAEMIKFDQILQEQQAEKTDMSFKYIIKKFLNLTFVEVLYKNKLKIKIKI